MRSENHVGLLLVCLSLPAEGGNIAIRREGITKVCVVADAEHARVLNKSCNKPNNPVPSP